MISFSEIYIKIFQSQKFLRLDKSKREVSKIIIWINVFPNNNNMNGYIP